MATASLFRTTLGGCALILGSIAGGAQAQAVPALSPQEAYEIGREAYVYFYPLVSMDVTRRVETHPASKSPSAAPVNRFAHLRAFPDANFRNVVRPNFDTLYSSAWLDLSHGPVIVSAPDTAGRYYLLPMLDMWTDVFAVPGKRTSGTRAANFAVVPPGWSGTLPAGVSRIDAPTSYAWVIGRTQTNGTKDYAAVHRVQDGYQIRPMKSMPTAKADSDVDLKTPPLVQVNTMPAARYFAYAAELMKANPPHTTDWSTLARLKRLGIEPGKPFDMQRLSPDNQAALQRAARDALKEMNDKLPTLARVSNGWQMNTESMGVYGNNYLKRAIVTMVGLGANQPEDAIYPLLITDADGQPLTGENRYLLHFDKDQLPPADAFWSVTMYDQEGFQVANPINRFAIGDRDALKYNPDGSLDLYLQHANPGADKEANWLPTPAKGPLGVTMRLYAPSPQALDGRWTPPAVRRLQ